MKKGVLQTQQQSYSVGVCCKGLFESNNYYPIMTATKETELMQRLPACCK